MARPSKRTPQRTAAIITSLEEGNTRRVAAAVNGVDVRTFERWCSRYAGFAASVSTAEALAERRMVEIIHQAAQGGSWRAALEWLRRRRRSDWGDVVRCELETDIDAEIVALLDRIASERGGGN